MGLIPDPRSQIQITQAKQHCVFFKEKSKIISRKMRRRVCLRHVKLLLSSGIPCTLFDPNEKHQLSIGESSGSTTNAAINNTNLPNNFPRNTALFPLSRMFQFLCSSIIITLCFASTSAFVGSVVNTKRYGKSSVHIKESTTKLDLFLAPQIGFAAACAGAVFAYVYSNIDSIKEVMNPNSICLHYNYTYYLTNMKSQTAHLQDCIYIYRLRRLQLTRLCQSRRHH